MNTLDPVGTSLQGYINATYDRLVSVFGPPNGEPDGYKTQAEWVLESPAGVVTIYDYKQGDCYCGEGEGIPAEQVTDWHIGGRSEAAAQWVTRQVQR